MSAEICGDNRFLVIERAKNDLFESTNIETAPREVEVIDSILFRCWQMGWLKKYEQRDRDANDKSISRQSS